MLKNYINKMVLGTAQLRMQYGIANTSGIPTKEESFRILQTAWNKGIRYFDTAPGYKTESLIGEFVTSQGIQNEIRVLTKIPAIDADSNWKDFICRSINNSLDNLQCKHVEVLFFHDPKDSILLLNEHEFFRSLLTKFPIKSLGVSVYEPDEIEAVKDCGFDLAFQFPFNLLDRRFENNSVSLGKRYARSIFLQGLLSSQSLGDKAPVELKRFHTLIKNDCSRKNISLLQLAFAFIINSVCFDFFLVGVDSIQQLKELLTLDLTLNINFNAFTDKWRTLINDRWLDPRKWN